mmetsp:Transcript_47633/g.113403  ORF Transcript_47633/g.113403 Transcript_47633/m.113403 type:complete len:221 (-) Transcript_47633:21-683(-)
MGLDFGEECKAAVADCRKDSSPTNWAAFMYEGKNKLVLRNTGSAGFAEFKESCPDDQCTWAFLRMTAGDQESKRAKFVVIQYNGPSLGGMAKSRAGVQKPEIEAAIGQHHVFFFADGPSDLLEEDVMEKITKSAGANYDLGSNSKGYESKIGEIKLSAGDAYRKTEKEGDGKAVVYFESALANSTPCDLSGRPTVAPPTEAKRNTDLAGKLDTSKWQASN